MAEYINREKTKRELLEWCISLNSPHLLSRDDTMFLLDNIPAADVAPVVHGRWDDSGRYTFPSGDTDVRCTICGCALAESEYRLYDWNYCPICGARMDGAE